MKGEYSLNLIDLGFDNPFDEIYLRKEIERFNGPDSEKIHGNVKYLIKDAPEGSLDDYLNKYFWTESSLKIPCLTIENEIWMSLTRMEVQSSFVPIVSSMGIVGTAGLGLGYTTIRIAQNDEVEKIDVYENNKDVITLFKDSFKGEKN